MVDSIKIVPYSEIQEDYYKHIFKGSAPVPVQLEKPDSGKETRGNLSIGKFYHFSRKPEFYMDDIHPGRYTAGSKLTDGVRSSGNSFQKSFYEGGYC